MLKPSEVSQWFPRHRQLHYIEKLIGRLGLTRCRAEYFVRLCGYLYLKEQLIQEREIQVPLVQLKTPSKWVPCSCREAKEVFYLNIDKGSERSAGQMIDKLKQLRLVEKRPTGDTFDLYIPLLPEFIESLDLEDDRSLFIDEFNCRRDPVIIANLITSNYDWMETKAELLTLRIKNLLIDWSTQYSKGMRVLRREDNKNPVGFYILFPVKDTSEKRFFEPASRGLHISAISDEDPFNIAIPGEDLCRSIFARSWVIDESYRDEGQPQLLKDVQLTIQAMIKDFPNLCDLYTLIIHPNYESLARYLGFQKITGDTQSSVYWVYLPIDSFLEKDIPDQLPWYVN